jgi:5-carboxymethyl-2-hydroxymuconate isomerase
MPHIVMEYSENLHPFIGAALRETHQTVTESGLFDPQAVKARSIAYADYILPEGGINFLHVTISILSGRSKEEKLLLSQAAFDVIKRIVANADRLSVDIHEMDKETYRK